MSVPGSTGQQGQQGNAGGRGPRGDVGATGWVNTVYTNFFPFTNPTGPAGPLGRLLIGGSNISGSYAIPAGGSGKTYQIVGDVIVTSYPSSGKWFVIFQNTNTDPHTITFPGTNSVGIGPGTFVTAAFDPSGIYFL